MLSRRELFSAGLAGGLTSTTSAAPAEAIEQESTREGQREIAKAISEIEDVLQQSLQPTLAYGNVARLRESMQTFLRAHSKFPDYYEVGPGVFVDLYDWHVKYQQPLNVVRQPDGRYTMQFMFSTMVLRPEQDPGYISFPFDKV